MQNRKVSVISVLVTMIAISNILYWALVSRYLNRRLISLSNSTLNTDIDNEHDREPVIDGIALISCGKQAKTDMVDQLIESLIFESSLSSSIPIYILTDRASCFNNSYYQQIAKNVKIIEIKHGIPCKRYKTTFFHYLPREPATDNILYLDIDMKATLYFDESVIPTMHHSAYKDKNCSLIMQSLTQNNYRNSGIFVANRVRSAACLDAWNDRLMKGMYEMDQDALKDSKECMENICYLSDDMVTLTSNVWNILNVANPKKMPLIHYTSILHKSEEERALYCDQNKSIGWKDRFWCILWESGWYKPLFLEIKTKSFC